MMRLADRLFGGQIKFTSRVDANHESCPTYIKAIMLCVQRGTTICADGLSSETLSKLYGQSPICPSYDYMFIETETAFKNEGVQSFGAALLITDRDKATSEVVAAVDLVQETQFGQVREGVRWVASVYPVFQFDGIAYLTGEYGVVVFDRDGMFVEGVSVRLQSVIAPDEMVSRITTRACCFGIACLQFLNCKNIRAVDAPELEQTPKWRRRMKAPEIKYKTLVVDGIKGAGGEGTGVNIGQMPLHLVRGHFAHYTEDKPLFGKYTGTFWKPAHARGELKNGAVIKDYKLQPRHIQ